MSHDIQLRRGGDLYTKIWNSRKSTYVEHKINDEELELHLHDTICFGPGVTIRDVFYLILRSPFVFLAVTVCPFLEEFVEEALDSYEPSDRNSKITALKLKWFMFIDNGEFYIHIDFHGIGKNNEESYAIELSPLNQLGLYPLLLDERVSILNIDSEETYLEMNKKFTLMNVVNGIVDEISFLGPPDIREFAREELEKRLGTSDAASTKRSSIENIRKELEASNNAMQRPCKICGLKIKKILFGQPLKVCSKCFLETKEN